MSITLQSRLRGCLLGGAIGDALGNPIEFLSLEEIRRSYGEAGVTGLVADHEGVVGRVTDDTQMTLFTAEAYLHAAVRARKRGIAGAETQMVRDAYLQWLDTQTLPSPPTDARPGSLHSEQWLYARRAPGNACLSGLTQTYVPNGYERLNGLAGPLNSDSKGCGTVMRSAPFGFFGQKVGHVFQMSAQCAQITHGHPTGYYSAGAFSVMITLLLDGATIAEAASGAIRQLADYPGHEETSSALAQAISLATSGDPTPEKVETLGGGWVAEEALAIGVYAALVEPSIDSALLLSVNHSGDSDSTGSICGNLLGAAYGVESLPAQWLSQVEGVDTIVRVADEVAAERG